MSSQRITWCSGAVICLALLLSACGEPEPEVWQPRVAADPVKLDEYRLTSRITGDVQARIQAQQGFRVGGKIIERLVDVGDHVERDQVLARLDPQELRNNLESARAEVNAREGELDLAQVNFSRQSQLLPKGYTSHSEYDRAEAELLSARSQLQAARASEDIARDMLGYAELRASSTGLVTARHAEIGQVVQASEPVFTLAEDGARDAVFNVYESLFSRIAEGQAISIHLVNDPAVETVGVVRELSPAIDDRTGTLRIKMALDNVPEKMTLGSVVSARIQPRSEHTVRVPWSSLFRKGSQPAVWVVDDEQHVSLQQVTVGRYTDGYVLIADGLRDGQRVVTAGGQLLHPGQKVEVVPRDKVVLTYPDEVQATGETP